MEETEYHFYSLEVDMDPVAVFVTCEEATKEYHRCKAKDDSAYYEIRRLDDIWGLVHRMSRIGDYSNEWMEEVLVQAHEMVERKKELAENATQKQDKK